MSQHRSTKLTVEECLTFDVGSLKQVLKSVNSATNSGEVSSWGTVTWRDDSSGRTEAVLGFWVGRITGEGLILLVDPERTTPFSNSVRLLAEYEVPITTTPTRIGGVRYWFRCPVEHDRKPCGRRVKKLYLPPGEEIFGCRQCHDLTYKSVQKHDKRETALARDPVALDAALRSKDFRRARLGVQALPLHVREMQKLGCW